MTGSHLWRVSSAVLFGGLMVLIPGIQVLTIPPVPLTAAVGNDEAHAEDPCSRALQVWKRGHASADLSEKITSFEEAARLCPDTAAYHYALGIVYGKANRLEDAFGAYADALKADSGFAPTHFNLATMYRSVRQYDSAISHVEQFIKLAADDERFTDLVKRAQQRLADVKAEQAAYEAGKGKYKQAVEEYLASLEVKDVEPEKQEARGVKELKLLSMTTAALLDYYGTAKDDRKCEILGKSLKLLDQMLFQERRQSRSGNTDPRLIATLELLSVVLDKTPGAAEIISQMIPHYSTNRSLDDIEQEIEEYSLDDDLLSEETGSVAGESVGSPEASNLDGTWVLRVSNRKHSWDGIPNPPDPIFNPDTAFQVTIIQNGANIRMTDFWPDTTIHGILNGTAITFSGVVSGRGYKYVWRIVLVLRMDSNSASGTHETDSDFEIALGLQYHYTADIDLVRNK